ncbi:MAG TPA: hypothetical protein VG370_05180 [Chloroflexota bacterium]|nr:hypothetical protein [Chloroflexota bacterium]
MTPRPRLAATVWGEDQVLCDAPGEEIALGLWAAVARRLIGETAPATVSIDCDDAETEMRLRVAGYRIAEVDQPEGGEVVESVTLEGEGPLGRLLEPVLRLPPEAPLGALAVGGDRGVDLDLGAGLDIWGPGALQALRSAAAELGVALLEQPPQE